MPDSSPETVTTDTTGVKASVEPVEAKDVVSADPSPADTKGEKGDIHAAVKAALKPKEKPPASDEHGSQPEAKPDAAAPKEGDEKGDDSDDLSEQELQQLRPKTRKRIENLLRDRTERDRKIEALEPRATRFDQMTKFVEDAGLSADEVNDGFNVMRDLRNHPLKAYERLKPIMAQLAQMAGDVLPEDLQTEVNYGRITEAHARDLARTRSTAAISQRQIETSEQRAQRNAQQDQVRQHVTTVASSVTAWERSQEKSDPDWKLKQPRVTELIELEVLRRRQSDPNYFPATPDEAKQIASKALEQVNGELKRFMPRRAITATPDAASTRSVAKPTSMLEAAKLGLAKAG